MNIEKNRLYRLGEDYIRFIIYEGAAMGVEPEIIDFYNNHPASGFTVEFTGKYGADQECLDSIIRYGNIVIEKTYLEKRDYGRRKIWKRAE